MTRSLVAFLGCLLVAGALYPWLIGLLTARHAGQRVQEFTPGSHRLKAGTPTMGGLLFCVLTVVAWLLLDRSRVGFVAVFAVGAGAAIGVLDDYENIRGLGALGLQGRQKLALQGLAGLLVGIGVDRAGLSRQAFYGTGAVDLHWGVVILTALAVVAASNAVNLTDGVDGLAGSCALLALATLWALGVHGQNRPVAVVSAALCGGVLAFLYFNWSPARVFMGDTGSLALGCALAVLSASLGLLWLLPLLGLVFVAETLSVIINVTAITRFGRRVFRASPLHHHFEELGLRDVRLVLGFAGAGAAAALLFALASVHAGVGL